jgi:tripartite-type tricarboxylate transporter receptor subunit TctC
VTVGFPGIAGMLPQIKAGKLRALAVTGAKRSPELPEVPTVAEAGVKGYDVTAWFGVVGPKGMPRDIVLRLHTEILRILKNPDVQRLLLNAGQEVAWQETPEGFGDVLKTEAAKWARMVKDSGATVN